MTAVWRLETLSPTQKLVLLSLADNANDQGECYPSMAQIARRTCLTDRAVRSAVRSLEEAGIVRSCARSGTSTVYFLSIPTIEPESTPRNVVPPRKDIPPRIDVPPTPEPDSAPPRNVVPPTPERPSAKPSLNRQLNRQGTVNRPDGVPETVWSDFLSIRKAKRSPMTQTALDGIDREARRAGMTLAQALAMCCQRGWQGFNADWLETARRAFPAGRETTEDHNRRAAAEFLGHMVDDGRTIDA